MKNVQDQNQARTGRVDSYGEPIAYDQPANDRRRVRQQSQTEAPQVSRLRKWMPYLAGGATASGLGASFFSIFQ